MTNDQEKKLRDILAELYNAESGTEMNEEQAVNKALASILELDKNKNCDIGRTDCEGWSCKGCAHFIGKQALNDKHKHSFVASDNNEAVCVACGKREALKERDDMKPNYGEREV